MLSTRESRICEFEKELYVSHKRGFIFRYVNLEETNQLNGSRMITGVEILFSDSVTQVQLSKIQAYILSNYGFETDDTLCMDVNILIVWY
jgi:hypothetical protein